MKSIILTFLVFFFFSCTKKVECGGAYGDAVKKGLVPYKTTSIELPDSLLYKLDYVRDKDEKYGAYGHLELPTEKFKKIVALVANDYKEKDIGMINLYGGNNNIADNEVLRWDNIQAYSVAYLDKHNNAKLDYIDLKNGKRESHYVSVYISSVKNYYSKLHSVKERSIIDIAQTGFEKRYFYIC